MLKLLILVTMLLWIYYFFGHSDLSGTLHSGGLIYLLSVVIVALIIVGFLS